MANDSPSKGLLLVDDELPFREALARRLAKRGFLVRQAGSGEAALAAMAAEPAPLVLMDVKMPGLDGLATLARLKAAHPRCEVIVLTGHANPADGVAGIKAGAFDYLTKPVSLDHLLGKLGQALERQERQERERAEQRFRQEMEARLRETERLAALGTLAAGVAHEINNPLAIIKEAAGWLAGRLAREGGGLDEAWRGNLTLALGKIEAGVERARRVTHQLLSLARKNDLTCQEFDARSLAEEALELTRKLAEERGATLILRPSGEDTMLWGDPFQLRQVLINLVTNALQAVGKGGRVELAVAPAGEEIAFVVRDDGPGIPAEHLGKIFEPFFSTKPPGQGTGLGLTVSLGIVEKLGGRIRAESQLGRGATFTVALPRRPREGACALPTAD